MSRAPKRCTKCRRLKPVREFPKDARQKSKLSPRCRQCHKKQHKSYYLKRKAAILAQQKSYNVANAEKRQNWRRRHRKQLRAYAKRYSAEQGKKLRASGRLHKARLRARIRREPPLTPIKAKPSPTRSKPLPSKPSVSPAAVPMPFEQDPRFVPGLSTPSPAIRPRLAQS